MDGLRLVVLDHPTDDHRLFVLDRYKRRRLTCGDNWGIEQRKFNQAINLLIDIKGNRSGSVDARRNGQDDADITKVCAGQDTPCRCLLRADKEGHRLTDVDNRFLIVFGHDRAA